MNTEELRVRVEKLLREAETEIARSHVATEKMNEDGNLEGAALEAAQQLFELGHYEAYAIVWNSLTGEEWPDMELTQKLLDELGQG